MILPSQGRKLTLLLVLARSFVWWPRFDDDIANVVKTCASCQATNHGAYLLHIVGHFMVKMFFDAHSKWLVMKSISATKTIKKLKILFATHGIRKKIVSD